MAGDMKLRERPAAAVSAYSPISWVLIGFWVFVTVRLMLLSPEMLGDPDTFLHVGIGNWILAQGHVPLTDPFSYPMAGQPWVAHEWLAGVLMSLVYGWAGWYGICVLAILACGLTLVILARFLMDRLPPVYALLLTVLAYSGLESHLLARPHVLAWPLLALWVTVLLNRSEQGRGPAFWLLPLLVVWANLHGSFTLGLALLPSFAMEAWSNRSDRRIRGLLAWAAFIVLAAGCAVVTPYGWAGVAFTGQLVSIKALASVTEWQPLTVTGHPLVLIWFGLLLLLGLRGWLRLPWVRLLLILGLGWQMLLHARFYSIFALLVPMLVALPLAVSQRAWPVASAPESVPDRWFRWLSGPSRSWAVGAVALAMVLPVLLFRQAALEPGAKHAPRAALEFLKGTGLLERGLNYYNYGGFLVWSGVPVFMDGRIDLRGDAGMQAYDDALARAESKGLAELLEQYAVAWTLFPAKDLGALHMDRQEGWCRSFVDDTSVVHMRCKK